MDATKYVELAAKTDLNQHQYQLAGFRAAANVDLLHAALGINTESGELTDILKKNILYGKDIDLINFMEELGDLLWYISIACRHLDISLESVFEQNIAKLKARYGDKFTEEAALNRDLDKERMVLEKHDSNFSC